MPKAKITNKDKEIDPEVLAVLDETPPDITEHIDPDADNPENQDPNPDFETVIVEEPETPAEEIEPETETPTPPKPPVTPEETPEDREKKYRSQQTEAQIQAAKSKALIDKVDEAANVVEPTEAELRSFVGRDGVNWDELTTFEQSMAKKTYISEKKFSLVHEAVQGQKDIDKWAKTVDDFIDSTDGKPEFVELSSHETEFRNFCMKEGHRTTPVDILLGYFLHNLPPVAKSRGSLFEKGGGGDKIVHKDGIVDADEARRLRIDKPREYARQVKAGRIKIEI